MADLTLALARLTGACLCGQVRFRLERAPIVTHACHCRQCQKLSGSAFRINAMIETDRITIIEGAPERTCGPDGHAEVRCTGCRLTLWGHHGRFGAALAFVGVGLLDEGERLAPEVHYFIRSKHPWVVLPPNVPAFAELGQFATTEAKARIEAALAAAVAA
jgi:hypothetical protein